MGISDHNGVLTNGSPSDDQDATEMLVVGCMGLALMGTLTGFAGPLIWAVFVKESWTWWLEVQMDSPLWIVGGVCGLVAGALAIARAFLLDVGAKVPARAWWGALGLTLFAGSWSAASLVGTPSPWIPAAMMVAAMWAPICCGPLLDHDGTEQVPNNA